jgi:branched-chain amino acid transport system ATP-binding protein
MSLLTIDRLSAGYGKLVVLHEVSLAVAPGQFLAILGPNGSGKSTLVKSVFGLTQLFRGSIKLDGTELVGLATESIGQHGLAYVPQRGNIFTTMTVKENLMLSVRQLGRSQASRALAETFDMFPILAERQKQPSGQLSGGERQMLAIAIGLLSQPRIMLLDEPSAGLAPLFVTEIFRQLSRLAGVGITLVVVEQNARSILQWCDDAYILREGRLVFQGSAADTLADEETIKSYLGVGGTTSLLPGTTTSG